MNNDAIINLLSSRQLIPAAILRNPSNRLTLAAAPLRRQGYTPETFKVGEVINARGNPSLSSTVKGVLIRGGLTRQDGTRIP